MNPLFRLVLSALFTALIVVGAYLSIPIPAMPVVLSNFFALLAGLMLGPVWGGISVLLYLVLGALGLPVFAGGSGGGGILLGPTGGFLIGFLLSALVAGLMAGTPGKRDSNGILKVPGFFRLTIAGIAGLIASYAIGLPWFQISLADKFPTLWAAFLLMLPYLIGDLVKVAVAVLLTRSLRPLLK